jgi:hypothetical protein
MFIGLAMGQDGGTGDGHLEEAMELKSLPLPGCRSDIKWDCMCEVLDYKAPRDPAGGMLERAACQTHHLDRTCPENGWGAPKPHFVTGLRTRVMGILESAYFSLVG